MSFLHSTLILSRAQFAFTVMFHIIWPVLTIGLSIFLVIFEIMWIVTKDDGYYRHLRFWSRLLLLNFAVGVATGLVMEFEFGTNWQPFTRATGGFFGNILGLEGTLAFMLEAGFLGIMMFGWKRVPKGLHLFSTIMVALGGSLSAFWILVANSWMQSPAGGHFTAEGVFVVTSFWGAITNPDMVGATSHMWVAAVETSAFVIGGISAWFIFKGRDVEQFLKTLKVAIVVAIVVTPLQIFLGDLQGLELAKIQPEKIAAMEAHWQTNPPGKGAPWNIVAWPDKTAQNNLWSVQVPNGLSLLEARSLTGRVRGLREFPVSDQPPVLVPFYSFRIMVLIGFFFFFVMIWSLVKWGRGRLRPDRVTKNRRFLWFWMICLPLGYTAVEAGWLVREEGRQPWIIYHVLRTSEAFTPHPPWVVAASLALLIAAYAALMVLFIVYARRILAAGLPVDRADRAADSGPDISPADGSSLDGGDR